MKRFFISAAVLTLITAGVMANAKKFANAGIYAVVTGGSNVQLTDQEAFARDLQLSSTGTQAQIVSSATSTAYPLIYDDGNGNVTNVITNLLP